jgi:hypothetical protein
MEKLEGPLVAAANRSGVHTLSFALVRETASDLYDALGDFADLIDLDRARLANRKEIVLRIIEAVKNMNMNTAASPSAR